MPTDSSHSSTRLEDRSWHDNSIHGLRLTDFKPEDGTATLTLEIDHIVEWIETDGKFNFRIAPALLRFYGVFGLKLALDYSIGPFGISAFQIDGIERSPVSNQHGNATLFQIDINNPPGGKLSFEADDWELTFLGPPTLSESLILPRST